MQRLRDALSRSRANRPFVIMMFGLGGLLVLGIIAIVLMLVLGNDGDTGEGIAQATATPPSLLPATDTPAPSPTSAATEPPRPTATRVLGTDTPAPDAATPTEAVATPPAAEPSATANPPASAATPTPVPDEQTPQTGLGWGWIVAIGLGLAGVVLVARRLRLAN